MADSTKLLLCLRKLIIAVFCLSFLLGCGKYSDISREEKNYIEQLEKAEDLLKSNPNNYQAWSDKGTNLLQLGRYQEALESLEQALKIKPDFYDAWNQKGVALSKLGKYQEAI
jgi:tetratricopeptide (TPR) repeat protein